MYFSDLTSQDASKKQLLNLFSQNRVPHALLLIGPEGCGHLQLALSFAALLSCNNPQENDACKKCSSCLKHEKFQHPDIHFSFPIHLLKSEHSEISDHRREIFVKTLIELKCLGKKSWYSAMGNENKQGVIGVQESHSILKKINLKSFFGGAKILIMWLPELMNLQAANKLLKLIEEPPEKTYFILVSDTPDKIINTIYSRMQHIVIPKMPLQHISVFLQQNFNLSIDSSHTLANFSNGNLNKAIISHLNASFSELNISLFIKWMRLCYSRNIAETIDWVNELSKMGREQVKDFISYSLEMSRHCILGNFSIFNDQITQKEEKFLEKFQPFINHKNISEINALMNEAYSHIERNANPKILMLDVSLQFYKLLKK